MKNRTDCSQRSAPSFHCMGIFQHSNQNISDFFHDAILIVILGNQSTSNSLRQLVPVNKRKVKEKLGKHLDLQTTKQFRHSESTVLPYFTICKAFFFLTV